MPRRRSRRVGGRRANWFAKCVGVKRRRGLSFKEAVRACKRGRGRGRRR